MGKENQKGASKESHVLRLRQLNGHRKSITHKQSKESNVHSNPPIFAPAFTAEHATHYGQPGCMPSDIQLKNKKPSGSEKAVGVLREGMEQIATQYKLERMLLHKCERPAGPQEGPEQNTQVLGKCVCGGGGGGTD